MGLLIILSVQDNGASLQAVAAGIAAVRLHLKTINPRSSQSTLWQMLYLSAHD
jgi:hypothetical protein